MLERLDEYQRDLEQELADVTELIKRLRADDAPQGQGEPQHDVGAAPEPGSGRPFRGQAAPANGLRESVATHGD